MARNVEHFEHGWSFVATSAGRTYSLRHLVGGRMVYERRRVHTVTFVGSQPVVEGVAADDYEASRSLLSIVRIDGRKHVREMADVPPDYSGFELVTHSDEIVAAYSPRSLAVKIREYDLARWTRHALVRNRDKQARMK
jgi:hypothetical protein